MSAQVLILLIELKKAIECEACKEFNKINGTGA